MSHVRVSPAQGVCHHTTFCKPVSARLTPKAPSWGGGLTRGVRLSWTCCPLRSTSIVIFSPACCLTSCCTCVSDGFCIPATITIRSSDLMPPSAAGEFGATSTMYVLKSLRVVLFCSVTRVGTPTPAWIESSAQANRTFIITPADKITTRHNPLLLEKLVGELIVSSSLFSPSMRTNPPIGKALKEYVVSPRWIENNRGGKPNPNSSTLQPAHLAVIKWPNSCTKTNTSKSTINTT